MERLHTAYAMLKNGEHIQLIVEQTGLSASEVEDIRRTYLPV